MQRCRMRITVTIDDDVLAVARALAAQTGCSLGSAISELARRSFQTASATQEDDERTVFEVPADSVPFTSEDVYRSLDEWP